MNQEVRLIIIKNKTMKTFWNIIHNCMADYLRTTENAINQRNAYYNKLELKTDGKES